MTNQLQPAKNREIIAVAITPEIKQRVDEKTRGELVAQYRKLFTGFSLAKWTKRYSWGRAWQKGVGLNAAMIMMAKQTMSPNNQAVKYLENIHNAYKKHWAKMTMTHPQRDTKTEESDANLKKMYAYAMRMINDATNAIMKILQRYNERTLEKTVGQEQAIERNMPQTEQTKRSAAPAQEQAKAPVAMPAPQQNAQKTASHAAQAIPTTKPATSKQPVAEKQAAAQQVPVKQAVAQPVVATKTNTAKQPESQKAMSAQPVVAKKPYVAPSVNVDTVKSHTQNVAPIVKQPKPYVAPTVTQHANAFEMAANRQKMQQATSVLRLRTQINIFTIQQRSQKTA